MLNKALHFHKSDLKLNLKSFPIIFVILPQDQCRDRMQGHEANDIPIWMH